MAKRKLTLSALFLAWLSVFFSGTVSCGDIPADSVALKAGVFIQPPFVMKKDGGGFEGMAIDLWETATRDMAIRSEFVLYETVGELLEAIREGRVDVGVGDLSVTHDRAKTVQFSFPWYDAGFRIMVNKPKTTFWSQLYKSRRFRVYLLFFLALAGLAFLMTLFRRRCDPDFPRDAKTGYTLSLLDVTSSVRSGELEQEYLGWVGHILSALWMVFGLAMVAYVTSSMTTAMATVHLGYDGVYELGDLTGKKVGALQGGLSAKYLRSLQLDVSVSPNLRDAVAKLRAGRVKAVVSDAPALEYWAYSHPEDGVQVVGDLFHPDKYAFAGNKKHAQLIDRVSVELIRLQETGEIDRMKMKYFGDGQGNLITDGW